MPVPEGRWLRRGRASRSGQTAPHPRSHSRPESLCFIERRGDACDVVDLHRGCRAFGVQPVSGTAQPDTRIRASSAPRTPRGGGDVHQLAAGSLPRAPVDLRGGLVGAQPLGGQDGVVGNQLTGLVAGVPAALLAITLSTAVLYAAKPLGTDVGGGALLRPATRVLSRWQATPGPPGLGREPDCPARGRCRSGWASTTPASGECRCSRLRARAAAPRTRPGQRGAARGDPVVDVVTIGPASMGCRRAGRSRRT